MTQEYAILHRFKSQFNIKEALSFDEKSLNIFRLK